MLSFFMNIFTSSDRVGVCYGYAGVSCLVTSIYRTLCFYQVYYALVFKAVKLAVLGYVKYLTQH